uniref:Magnesium transporter n=1 Tax=Macrostomum lignano TaxID=282301 RepID=A0A1I8JN91_9PLAT
MVQKEIWPRPQLTMAFGSCGLNSTWWVVGFVYSAQQLSFVVGAEGDATDGSLKVLLADDVKNTDMRLALHFAVPAGLTGGQGIAVRVYCDAASKSTQSTQEISPMHIIRMLSIVPLGAAIDIVQHRRPQRMKYTSSPLLSKLFLQVAALEPYTHSSWQLTVRASWLLAGSKGAGISAGDVQNYSRFCPDAMGLTETANCPDCGEFDTVRHILARPALARGPLPRLHGNPRGRELVGVPTRLFGLLRSMGAHVPVHFGLTPTRTSPEEEEEKEEERRITDLASFESLPRWLDRARASIGGSGATGEGGEFECCLVGNKADEEYRRLVSHREAQRYANQLGVPYIETSALNVVNVQKAFVDLTLAIMRSRLPLQEDRSQTAAVKLRQQKAQQRLQSSAEAFTDEAESIGYRRRRKLACEKLKMKLISKLLLRRYPAKKIELRKEIGYSKESASLSGASSGPGIFVSPKGILQESKSVGLSFIMWAVTGIFSALGAVCYAELGTTIPGPGASTSTYCRSWAPCQPFWCFGITFVAIGAVSNAANSLLFAKYCLSPLFVGCPVPELLTRATASCL